jgi:hypothetical protein
VKAELLGVERSTACADESMVAGVPVPPDRGEPVAAAPVALEAPGYPGTAHVQSWTFERPAKSAIRVRRDWTEGSAACDRSAAYATTSLSEVYVASVPTASFGCFCLWTFLYGSLGGRRR